MSATAGLSREQLRFIPGQHGGSVAGELTVIDRDNETGEEIAIDCTRFGSGAYTVPSSVEHLRFKSKAKFILRSFAVGDVLRNPERRNGGAALIKSDLCRDVQPTHFAIQKDTVFNIIRRAIHRRFPGR